MFAHVTAQLPTHFATDLKYLLDSISADAPYDKRKPTVLKRSTASDEARLQQLLSVVELGDRTPSQLRHMRTLVGSFEIDDNSATALSEMSFSEHQFSLCSQKNNLLPTGLTLEAANNTKIHTYGQKMLTFNLGLRRNFPSVFLIADIQCPILDIDFLTKFGLIVDLRNRKLCDSLTSLSVSGKLTSISSIGLRLALPADNVFTELLLQFPALYQSSNDFPEPKHEVTHHILTHGPPVTARHRGLPQTSSLLPRQSSNICFVSVSFVFPVAHGPPRFIWFPKSPMATGDLAEITGR
ncbi:unnamed protein product [Dicrocoelium dendriticum]|nr:unnamed protein product [Dicrocoelium dendriticum]